MSTILESLQVVLKGAGEGRGVNRGKTSKDHFRLNTLQCLKPFCNLLRLTSPAQVKRVYVNERDFARLWLKSGRERLTGLSRNRP